MRVKVLLLFALLINAIGYCAAGNIFFKGTVINSEDGSKIPYANVIAYFLPDSTLAGYSITKEDGSFSLSMPKIQNGILLKISCLGFKEGSAKINKGENNIVISMKPDSKMLETVIVKGRANAFKVKEDTIDYNFKKYTTGNERVLKDILAKLPGMDVDDKGQITVNGQVVKKILIDGQDFFGNQNEQITNNLPANFIGKIQLRKNYSEYSLLSGFNTQKGNALNVGIDSIHHNKLTGNTELLSGWNSKYRIAINGYSFGSKTMLGFNVKYFNSGEEMMTLMDYIKLLGSVKDYAQSFGASDRVISNNSQIPFFLISNINSYKRRNGLLSTNVAWNPNGKIKLNAYYVLNYENNQGIYNIARNYKESNSIDILNKETRSCRQFHHMGINFKYSLTETSAIDSHADFTVMPQDENSSFEQYFQKDKQCENIVNQSISFMKNWNKKNLFTISEQTLYEYGRNKIAVSSDSSLYNVSNLNDVSQKQTNLSLDVLFTASWIHKLSKKWQMNMSSGWNLHRKNISASSTLDDLKINDQKLVTNVYNYSLRFSKKRGLFHFDGGFTIADINNKLYKDKIVLLPNVTLELATNSTNSISLTYKSEYRMDDNYFADGLILDDYRQISAYNNLINILHKTQRLNLLVNYFDLLNDFSFIMNSGCQFTENPYIENFSVNGKSINVTMLQSNKSNQTQYAYFNIKKGFRAPLTVTLKSTITNFKYQSAYQGVISKDRISKIDGSMALSSRLKSMLNFDVGYKILFQQNKTGISGRIINMGNHEIYLKPTILQKEVFELGFPISYIIDNTFEKTYHNINIGLTGQYNVGRWTFTIDGKKYITHK